MSLLPPPVTLSLDNQILTLLECRAEGIRTSLLARVCATRSGNTQSTGEGTPDRLNVAIDKSLRRLARRSLVEEDPDEPGRWRLVL